MSSSTSHFHVGVDFPVYALAWLDDDHVAVTGGGGAGRSGIKNSLVGAIYLALAALCSCSVVSSFEHQLEVVPCHARAGSLHVNATMMMIMALCST